MATLDEHFLDGSAVEDLQTVARTINRPTKHASNPLFGSASWTWDRDINYVCAAKIGSTVRLWYMGVSTAPELYACTATSTDGVTFTKPNLGIISYGGNTNNNIMRSAHQTIIGVHYEAAAALDYVGVGETTTGGANDGVFLYSSANGETWTTQQTLYSGALDGDYKEGRTITQMADGRYLVSYSQGHVPQRRNPGLYRSQTSDITGTWDNLGIVFDVKDGESQCYHFSLGGQVGGVLLAVACRFVETTDQIDKVSLMYSRTGTEWKVADAEWYAIGTSGAWDDEWVLADAHPIEIGDDWFFYYTGSAEDHATAPPRSVYVGAVTIPKGRIASIGTTGTVRLLPITLGAADALTVNCDASGGSLNVELLDERNQVIYGYSRADCDTITTDTFGTVVTWAGRGLIASRTVKLVFVLDSATLHSISVGAA